MRSEHKTDFSYYRTRETKIQLHTMQAMEEQLRLQAMMEQERRRREEEEKARGRLSAVPAQMNELELKLAKLQLAENKRKKEIERYV